MSGAFAYSSACKDEAEIGLIKVGVCGEGVCGWVWVGVGGWVCVCGGCGGVGVWVCVGVRACACVHVRACVVRACVCVYASIVISILAGYIYVQFIGDCLPSVNSVFTSCALCI